MRDYPGLDSLFCCAFFVFFAADHIKTKRKKNQLSLDSFFATRFLVVLLAVMIQVDQSASGEALAKAAQRFGPFVKYSQN